MPAAFPIRAVLADARRDVGAAVAGGPARRSCGPVAAVVRTLEGRRERAPGAGGDDARSRRTLERAYPASNRGVGVTVRPLLDKVVVGDPRHAAGAAGDGDASCCSSRARTSPTRCSRALRPSAGDGRANRARRQPRAGHPAAADRERAAGGAGAVAGLAFALWGDQWLARPCCRPAACRGSRSVSFDVRVFWRRQSRRWLSGLATAALAPALQLCKPDVHCRPSGWREGRDRGNRAEADRSVLVAGR